jgi:hypothetical protein
MSDATPAAARDTDADVGPQGEDDTKKGTRIFTTHFFRARKGADVVFSQQPPPPPKTVRRPARVARMLALAHRLQQAIDSGEIEDRATLARRFGITRARVTQLLNLTLLAPDIQEQVLALEAVDGLEPTSERALREVSWAMEWEEQRRRWAGGFT